MRSLVTDLEEYERDGFLGWCLVADVARYGMASPPREWVPGP
jgi:hypothetical protein